MRGITWFRSRLVLWPLACRERCPDRIGIIMGAGLFQGVPREGVICPHPIRDEPLSIVKLLDYGAADEPCAASKVRLQADSRHLSTVLNATPQGQSSCCIIA